jgi:ankyrin repeat protein
MESILFRVPQDILLVIADTLPAPDLNSLSQTCRVLGSILTPILYRLGAREAVTVNDLQPICWASKEGRLNTIKQLLAQGARTVGLRNLCGECDELHTNTALHWAARGGHAELVKFYLDIGMDINAVDDRNATPLHWIGKGEGSLEVAQALLDHGVDTEIRDCDGDTAIIWALNAKLIPLVKLLIDSGMDLKTLNRTQRYRIDDELSEAYAKRDIISTRVKVLLVDGVESRAISYMLENAALYNDLSTIELMLDAGLDLRSLTDMGARALYLAVVGDHEEAVRLLLSRGAKPNIPNSHSDWPLEAAITRGCPRIVKLLLDAGGL